MGVPTKFVVCLIVALAFSLASSSPVHAQYYGSYPVVSSDPIISSGVPIISPSAPVVSPRSFAPSYHDQTYAYPPRVESYPLESTAVIRSPGSSVPTGQIIHSTVTSSAEIIRPSRTESSSPVAARHDGVIRSASRRSVGQSARPRNRHTDQASQPIPRRQPVTEPARQHAVDPEPVFQLASAQNYRPDNTTPFAPVRRPFWVQDQWHHGREISIANARRTAADLRQMADNALEVVADIANENADLADQWADVAQLESDVATRVTAAEEKLAAATRDFHDVNAKLAHHGLTPTIGLLLRHKKEQLDGWQVHDSQTFLVGPELARSRQNQLELELIRFDGTHPTEQAEQIINEAATRFTEQQYHATKSQLEELLGQRYQWLGMVEQAYHDYQEKLGQLASATTASAELTDDFRKLIDRHVTWIRSGDAVSLADMGDLGGGIAALFDTRRSSDFGPTIRRKWKTGSVGGLTTLALMLFMLIVRWRAKAWLVGIGSRTKMRTATRSSRKIAASFLTVLVSLAIPTILYAAGRWLGRGVVSESTLIASSGLYAASLVAWLVELPRQLLRKNGYVEKHIELELPGRQNANRHLMLVGVVLVVGAYTVILMESLDHGLWRDSVARFGFMGLMLVVAWVAHYALRTKGGFLEPMIARYGGSVIHHARVILYLAGLAFPLGMIALSAFGFGYTAHALVARAMITLIGLMVAATLWGAVQAMSVRVWQLLTNSTPERKFDQYGEIETEIHAPDVGTLGNHYLELRHHLAFLCQGALVVGAVAALGWLWVDALPNVGLSNPVVWNIQESVNESVIDATGNPVTTTSVKTTPVTALHLLLASATLFVAFQIAKLLPALFDALVLQRVSFDEGMEHFSLVLGRFLLFGIGCIGAGELIGLRWQTIQWLIVGLAVGLGFGLQDMVRNLFGGLIVLFEKPARLGDLITVGEVTGRVAMQRLRTTIVADDEGREIIVPNKNFVTQDVVQWMGAGRLSVIPIEVAVTRDQRAADLCRSLTELVIEQPEVLLTPGPQATLVCVGKRSQRIELRVWIEDQHHATRYRDSLLKLVRQYLAEKRQLAGEQPEQPKMPAPADIDGDDLDWDRSKRRRRRA